MSHTIQGYTGAGESQMLIGYARTSPVDQQASRLLKSAAFGQLELIRLSPSMSRALPNAPQ
jgi:hypothetical protein